MYKCDTTGKATICALVCKRIASVFTTTSIHSRVMVDMNTYTRMHLHTIATKPFDLFRNLSSLYKYVCCIAVENCFNEGSFTIYLIYVTFFHLATLYCAYVECVLMPAHICIFAHVLCNVHCTYNTLPTTAPTPLSLSLSRIMFI